MTGPLLALSLAAALAGQDAAGAPPAAPQEPTTRLEDVVVSRPDALEALAREFVDSAAAAPAYRGLARWNAELCLGVVGLRAEAAHAIIDRVSDVARPLGVRLGQPGCAPNAVIVAASDGQQLAEALVAERRRAFRIGFTRSNRGTRALEEFGTSDAAVRWWHISFPYCASSGALAIRIFQGPPACASSFKRSTGIVDYLSRVLVIVDVPRLEGADLDQLSDYLAMVVLAQVDAEADLSRFDTVLNSFTPAGGEGGLTDWDRGYLEALYGAGRYRLDPEAHAEALAQLMSRQAAPGDAE